MSARAASGVRHSERTEEEQHHRRADREEPHAAPEAPHDTLNGSDGGRGRDQPPREGEKQRPAKDQDRTIVRGDPREARSGGRASRASAVATTSIGRAQAFGSS